MRIVFTEPSPLKSVVPWSITSGLLLVWLYGLLTTNRMGGFIDAFLIAGAAMMLVSLFLGRRVASVGADSVQDSDELAEAPLRRWPLKAAPALARLVRAVASK